MWKKKMFIYCIPLFILPYDRGASGGINKMVQPQTNEIISKYVMRNSQTQFIVKRFFYVDLNYVWEKNINKRYEIYH